MIPPTYTRASYCPVMALERVIWLVATCSFFVLLSAGISINGHSGAEEPECAHKYLDQYRDGPEVRTYSLDGSGC